MAEKNLLPVPSDEYLARCQELKERISSKIKDISNKTTPQVDGSGKKVIDKKDGRDYIIEAYMRNQLNELFPGWSWRRAGGLTFLGSEWVTADGELEIIDENLLGFGVIPPIRRYWGGDGARIQFKSCPCRKRNNNVPVSSCLQCKGTGGLPHTPENVIDIGDNVKTAITGAFKVSINRLCNIGDDVYGKRVKEEGAGSQEEYETTVLETGNREEQKKVFVKKANDLGFKKPSDIYHILQVKSYDQIEDFEKALETLEEVKGKENTTE